jgi:hypothetical protein
METTKNKNTIETATSDVENQLQLVNQKTKKETALVKNNVSNILE